MAKPKGMQDVSVNYVVPGYLIEQRIEQSINDLVRGAVESQISEAVADAVSGLVEEVGRKRIAAEVEKVLAEGWQTTDSYGSVTGGRKSLKDRVSELLSRRDSYNSRSWMDELVKNQVQEALNKELKKDIDGAREKFKSEVDSVLTGVIKKAVSEHFGIKA